LQLRIVCCERGDCSARKGGVARVSVLARRLQVALLSKFHVEYAISFKEVLILDFFPICA
jgi:hypothetical protein